jgi:membrane protein YqaA with SNARE-associated domain
MLAGLKKELGGYCSRLDHFDNQFLTYTVMLHDWLSHPGYAALFTVSFLASTILPLGSEWLLVMMLVNGSDPLATVGTATAGNYLGAVTTYLIGMFGGNWLVTKLLRVSPEQQERARCHYRRYGSFSLLFSWLPVIGDPLCMVGGVLRINFWLFTLLVASGKLVRYAAAAFITLRAAG